MEEPPLQERLRFKIRDLHYAGVGPSDDKSALIYMTSQEYDDLLRENPHTILSYDDDYGDNVQVGSSLELYQRCKESQPRHRTPSFRINSSKEAREAWLATEFPYRNPHENLRHLRHKMTSWSSPTTSDQEEEADMDDAVSSGPPSPRSTLTPTSDSEDGTWEKVLSDESNTTLDGKPKQEEKEEFVEAELPANEPMRVLSPRPDPHSSPAPPGDHFRHSRLDSSPQRGPRGGKQCQRPHSHRQRCRWARHSHHGLNRSETTPRYHHHHDHEHGHCHGHGRHASEGMQSRGREGYNPHRSWEAFEHWRQGNHLLRSDAPKGGDDPGQKVSFAEEVQAVPSLVKSRSAPLNTTMKSYEEVPDRPGSSKARPVFLEAMDSEVQRLVEEQQRLKSEISRLKLEEQKRKSQIAALANHNQPSVARAQPTPTIPTPDSVIEPTPELLPQGIGNFLRSVGRYTSEVKRWLPPTASERLTSFQNNLQRHIPPIHNPDAGSAVTRDNSPSGDVSRSTLIGAIGPHFTNLADVLSKAAERARELAHQTRTADQRAAMMVAEGVTAIMADFEGKGRKLAGVMDSMAQECHRVANHLNDHEGIGPLEQGVLPASGGNTAEGSRDKEIDDDTAVKFDRELPFHPPTPTRDQEVKKGNDTSTKEVITISKTTDDRVLCFNHGHDINEIQLSRAFNQLGFVFKGYQVKDNEFGAIEFATKRAAQAAFEEISGHQVGDFIAALSTLVKKGQRNEIKQDSFRPLSTDRSSNSTDIPAASKRQSAPELSKPSTVMPICFDSTQAMTMLGTPTASSQNKGVNTGDPSDHIERRARLLRALIDANIQEPEQRNKILEALPAEWRVTKPVNSAVHGETDAKGPQQRNHEEEQHDAILESIVVNDASSPRPAVPAKTPFSPMISGNLNQKDLMAPHPMKLDRRAPSMEAEKGATPTTSEKGKAPERPAKVAFRDPCVFDELAQAESSATGLARGNTISLPLRSRPRSVYAPGEDGDSLYLYSRTMGAGQPFVPADAKPLPEIPRRHTSKYFPNDSQNNLLDRQLPATQNLRYPLTNPCRSTSISVNRLGSPIRRSQSILSTASSDSMQHMSPEDLNHKSHLSYGGTPIPRQSCNSKPAQEEGTGRKQASQPQKPAPSRAPGGPAGPIRPPAPQPPRAPHPLPPPPPPRPRRQEPETKPRSDEDKTYLYYAYGSGNLSVGKCVHLLVQMGYKDDSEIDTLQRYAWDADGDVEVAIELIEEARRSGDKKDLLAELGRLHHPLSRPY